MVLSSAENELRPATVLTVRRNWAARLRAWNSADALSFCGFSAMLMMIVDDRRCAKQSQAVWRAVAHSRRHCDLIKLRTNPDEPTVPAAASPDCDHPKVNKSLPPGPTVFIQRDFFTTELLVCRLVYICIHFCYTLGNHDYFLRNTYLSGKNVVAIFSVWSRGHFQHKMYKNMNITRKN